MQDVIFEAQVEGESHTSEHVFSSWPYAIKQVRVMATIMNKSITLSLKKDRDMSVVVNPNVKPKSVKDGK